MHTHTHTHLSIVQYASSHHESNLLYPTQENDSSQFYLYSLTHMYLPMCLSIVDRCVYLAWHLCVCVRVR